MITLQPFRTREYISSLKGFNHPDDDRSYIHYFYVRKHRKNQVFVINDDDDTLWWRDPKNIWHQTIWSKGVSFVTKNPMRTNALILMTLVGYVLLITQ